MHNTHWEFNLRLADIFIKILLIKIYDIELERYFPWHHSELFNFCYE